MCLQIYKTRCEKNCAGATYVFEGQNYFYYYHLYFFIVDPTAEFKLTREEKKRIYTKLAYTTICLQII